MKSLKMKRNWGVILKFMIVFILLILLTRFSGEKNNSFMLDFADNIVLGAFRTRRYSLPLSDYDFTALWLSLLTSVAWVFVGWRGVYYKGKSFVKNVIKFAGIYLVICSIFYIGNIIVGGAASPSNLIFAFLLVMVAWLMTPFLGVGILYNIAYDAIGLADFFGGHTAFVCFLSTWFTLIGIFCIGAKMIRVRRKKNSV